MIHVRVLRLAIGENQAAGRPVAAPIEILEGGLSRRVWGVTFNGPTTLRWADNDHESPWSPRLAVHCWLETEGPIEERIEP